MNVSGEKHLPSDMGKIHKFELNEIDFRYWIRIGLRGKEAFFDFETFSTFFVGIFPVNFYPCIAYFSKSYKNSFVAVCL